MGLFFKGREISDDTVLNHLLGKGVPSIAKWEKNEGTPNYDTKNMGDELGERIWMWINLQNGKVIITGDEGNGWAVELIYGNSEEDALRKYHEKYTMKNKTPYNSSLEEDDDERMC